MFSDIVEIRGQDKMLLKNQIEKKKLEVTVKEYASVEDPLNMHRTASNETNLVSEIPNIINEENVIAAPGQGKKQFQF